MPMKLEKAQMARRAESENQMAKKDQRIEIADSFDEARFPGQKSTVVERALRISAPSPRLNGFLGLKE